MQKIKISRVEKVMNKFIALIAAFQFVMCIIMGVCDGFWVVTKIILFLFFVKILNNKTKNQTNCFLFFPSLTNKSSYIDCTVLGFS